MKKVVISDLDGTLLNSRGEIELEIVDEIRRLKENNIRFSVATGRTLDNTIPYLSILKPNLPVVLFNGAAVYDFKREEFISLYFIPEEAINKIIEIYDKSHLKYNIALVAFESQSKYSHKKCLVEKYSSIVSSSAKEISNIKVLESGSYLKIMILGEEEELRLFSKRELNGFNYFYTSSNSIEIVSQEINKWSGIERALEYSKFSEMYVYAVGDSFNDESMLRNADIGILMKNGEMELKEVANTVTDSTNDERGLKEVLIKINNGEI